MTAQTLPALVTEWVIVVFISALAAMILWKIYRGHIDLSGLVSESPVPPSIGPGKASLSRLQLLLFTFVIVGLFLILSLQKGEFTPIPGEVLGLLGISGGSYILAKGIQANS